MKFSTHKLNRAFRAWEATRNRTRGARSELARRVSVNPSSVSRWLLGQSKPDRAIWHAIAETLNCTVEDLILKESL